MKIRGLFIAICAICVYVTSSAQDYFLHVWQKDGSVTQYDVSEVDSITFSMSGEPTEMELEMTATQLASKMFLACNIGNTFESVGCSTTSSNESCWGSPKITQQIIDAYKEAGFNTVRIPVAWNTYAEANGGVIPDWWMKRIQEVVDYCIKDDLYVLLNIHWDGGWLERHVEAASQSSVNKTQENLWGQIASHFKNYDEHLVFCSANEPDTENDEQAAILKSYHQTFVNTVRASGGYNGTRCLVIQCAGTAADKAVQYDYMPTDIVPNRLLMEFHYYPYTYALMEEDADWGPAHWFWGKDYQNIIVDGVNRSCSWHTEETVISEFSAIKAKFVDKGIPVVMGEFAIMNRELSAEWQDKFEECRAAYYYFLTKTAKNYGIVPVLWDTPNGSKSVIDRDKCTVGNQKAMEGLLKGANEGVYPF